VYENWNLALMARSRGLGARVALDGFGGDGLFQVSPVYFADLVRTGRWLTLAREWRARGFVVTHRNLYHLLARPLVPSPVQSVIARARGRGPVRGPNERAIPPWIRPEFAAEYGLDALTRTPVVRRPGETLAACETQWHLRTPWVPAMLSHLSTLALAAGVEIRSPLYDRRIVEFAARRPREDRALGGETKRLLRRSMKGLLPDAVLAPRKSRTGMTTGYLAKSMHTGLAQVLLDTFKESLLAESGVIDIKQYWQAAGRYLRGRDPNSAVELFLTLQAELWLRAHARTGRAEYSAGRHDAIAVTAGR
jgi:asparagine synthase (glutamine-hydrolysing)